VLRAREVSEIVHAVPNASPRSIGGQFDERDQNALQTFVAKLAVENGIEFCSEQLFEP
jgi:hypothetical protein